MEPETPPKDTRLIREITLRNILSFGPDTPPFELRPLNVLIGPNGSGKSNLIDCIRLMRATPQKEGIRIVSGRSGGARNWIWMGEYPKSLEQIVKEGKNLPDQGSIFDNAYLSIKIAVKSNKIITHDLTLEYPFINSDLQVRSERILDIDGLTEYDSLHDRDANGSYVEGRAYMLHAEPQSFLEKRWDESKHPAALSLIKSYSRISIYSEFSFGRDSILRLPVAADLPKDKLIESLINLPLVVNRLISRPMVKDSILSHLKDLSETFSDILTPLASGIHMDLNLVADGRSVPATRLSDGTLRYLCLLAILCDPEPPPLICIEEPELGLHPDIIGKLAELLIEASTRTQLIVTTHSDILVEALTETPESVVVCEKHDGKTEMHRLTKGEVEPWVDKYRLGELWLRGGIGGTRW